jgi:hypothetical protein
VLIRQRSSGVAHQAVLIRHYSADSADRDRRSPGAARTVRLIAIVRATHGSADMTQEPPRSAEQRKRDTLAKLEQEIDV